jgi:hypothetical protein
MVLEQVALDPFQCMSPMRFMYIKFGIEIVSLEENIYHMPKKPSMEEENKNDGAKNYTNLLLEQALTQ